MPNTPNFNWPTPADTDYVTNGALAMRDLGDGIDTSLVDLKGGTTGQVLAKASNTDLDYVWTTPNPGDVTAVNVTSPITGGGTGGDVTIGIQDGTTTQKGAVQLEDSTASTSTTKAATPNSVKSAYDLANGAIPKSLVDAAGDLLVGTADNTVGRLAKGTAGQVLKVNSGGTALEWGAANGGGKIAQVLQAVKTDTFTSSSASFVDITGLSITITPTSSTSKIMVMMTVTGASNTSTSNSKAMVRLIRGATPIGIADAAGSAQQATGYISTRSTASTTIAFTSAANYLDSPATTSATTYKVQGFVGGGSLYINRDEEGDTTSSGSGRFISTLTVMEVLA